VSDRRAQFFLIAAVVCFALLPVADDEHRELTVGVGVVYVLLALASALDFRSRR
jgi:hypothetical protein